MLFFVKPTAKIPINIVIKTKIKAIFLGKFAEKMLTKNETA